MIYIMKSRLARDTQHNSASKTNETKQKQPKDFLLKYLGVRNAVRSFKKKKITIWNPEEYGNCCFVRKVQRS